MDAANWIAIGALAVPAAALLATFFAPDRSKAKLEALEQAIKVKNGAGVSAADKKELERFIKYTSRQLGDVWWRHPFTLIAAVSLLFAAVWLFVGVVSIGYGNLEDMKGLWWTLLIGYFVGGIALLWLTAVKQKRAGLLDKLI